MPLTIDDIKKMPPKVKALVICLIYIIFGYFYYFYFLQDNFTKRGDLQTKLQELEDQIARKERLAAELGKYMKEVDILKDSFKMALTKLPIRKEIPELLRSVAQSGEKSGIQFTVFEPQAPVKKPIGGKNEAAQKPAEQKPADPKAKPAAQAEEDYYEEIPVKLTLKGGYHNAALFFDKVAKLPRIINIEDIVIGDAKPVKGKGASLTISCMLKTYMFVQKEEKGKKTDEKKK